MCLCFFANLNYDQGLLQANRFRLTPQAPEGGAHAPGRVLAPPSVAGGSHFTIA